MRNAIIVLTTILLIITSSFYLVAIQEPSPEDVMVTFLETLLVATPEKYDQIFHINIFDQLEVDTYTLDTYASMATDRMMISLVANRTVALSSEVAYKTNSYVSLRDLEITLTQESDHKTYFNFKGITRVTTIESSDFIDYPLVGQIGIVEVDGVLKVDALKLFTIKMLDHLVQYENLSL
jgi:hypothetical protein